MSKTKTSVKVRINGTATNPFHQYGLVRNPYPQLGRSEYYQAEMQLNSLGAEPISSTDQIRSILIGFSTEFIDLCCSQFQPGKMVEFEVYW